MKRRVLSIVGAGRLARALLPALARARWRVAAVAAPRRGEARRAARLAGPGTRATTDPVAAAEAGSIVLLAVPDAAIAPLAARLAREAAGWRGRVVLHHAGALGPEVLAPLARAGAATGVLHPLQTLSGPRGARLLAGSRARVEGHAVALAVARGLCRDLGLVPLTLARRPTAARRAAYHAAAALASNDVAALLALALRLAERAGIPASAALPALLPLARGTLRRIEQDGIEAALTGPAVRGDRATLARHRQALQRISPQGAAAHRMLSEVLAHLARRRRSAGPAGRRYSVPTPPEAS